MTTVPAPTPDVILDYNKSNQEYTGVVISDGSIVFRFIQNPLLGINFFGNLPSTSIPFRDYLNSDGSEVVASTTPTIAVQGRFTRGLLVTSFLFQDVTFGGPNYNVTEVNINGLNILDSPIVINSDAYIAGVLIDDEILIPENSAITIILDAAFLPAVTLVKFEGSYA
jgi:hypothetical protein